MAWLALAWHGFSFTLFGRTSPLRIETCFLIPRCQRRLALRCLMPVTTYELKNGVPNKMCPLRATISDR